MIKQTDFEGMVKTVARFLDAYSGIKPSNILNADSIRGTDLSEMISESQSFSPKANSAFMLFEFLENPEDDYITSGEKEGNMCTIQSYDLHLKIYGNSSPDVAQRVSALFKVPDIALSLRDEGVFIKGVSPIVPMNEFVNNTWLIRRDLVVKTQIRFEIQSLSEDPGVFGDIQGISVVVLTQQTRN